MQRTFLTNLALLLVLNLLVKPFYILGIDAGVQNAVGSETYGLYAALLSLSFLMNILLDLGITNYSTRHVAQHGHLMAKYISGIAGARLVLVVLYALLTGGAALWLGYRGAPLGLLGWLVLNQALAATLLYLRGNIAGAQRYRQDSLLSVLDRVLLIGVLGWLLWGRTSGTPFRIEWFVWAQTGAYVVSVLVALVLVRRLGARVRPQWKPAFSLAVVRQSLPYALLILLMTFYYRTDTLMLERLLPDGALQAGIYAQGFRFFEALNMLGYLFAGLLLPMFSRLLKQGDDISPLVNLSFRMLLGGALAVALLGSLNAQAVMDLRYDAHTAQSAHAFAILLWCFVSVCITYVFGTLLTAAGDLRLLNYMAASGALINVGLNLVLIPRYQAEGAAWASLVTQGATAVFQLVLAARRHKLTGLGAVLLRTGALALVLTGVLVLLARWDLGFGFMCLAYAPMAVGGAWLTGLLRVNDLRTLFARAEA